MGNLYPFDEAQRDLTQVNNELRRELEVLKHGSGGGTSGGMSEENLKRLYTLQTRRPLI